jgi:CHAD domain-containing protein
MSDLPALPPRAPAGEALRAAARDILATARAAIAGRRRGPEAVHDLRRALKRWRALLRLIEPTVGGEARQLRGEARDLAGSLSGARDAQAALDALADLERHGLALPARAHARLRSRLESLRQAAPLDAGTRARLAAALDRADAQVARWPLEGITFEEMADRLTRHYRRARRLVPADWAAAEPQRLHELRKRVVTHRHQMDLVEALWPRFVKMWTGEAQRLRDRLGKHQDALVLADLTQPHRPLARWRSQLAEPIARRRRANAARAAHIAARLLADKPAAFRRRLAAMGESGAAPVTPDGRAPAAGDR